MKRIMCSAFIVLAMGSAHALASEDDAPPGKIIVARTQGDAIVLYNATSEVIAIVSAKNADSDAKTRLERDALLVLASRLPLLTNASTATVRVVYDKTGDVSPAYNTPTFAGEERFANLSMSLRDAKADRDGWKEAARDNKRTLPPFVAFEIIGSLPPR